MNMANHNMIFATTLYVFILLLTILSATRASISKTGFTTDLIHVDSPTSPFYNASQTDYDRLRNAFIRSMNRPYRFSRNPKYSIQSIASMSLLRTAGEYYIDVSFGTPPVQASLIVDTGSDLIWTQCQPCITCYNQAMPIFDPRLSSTFKPTQCETRPCQDIGNGLSGCTADHSCSYNYRYSGGSFTKGILATDTITVGSFSLPNAFFGCGNDNGQFAVQGSGILGLGRTSLSLLSQLNPENGRQFSYCLTSWYRTSKIYFGSDAIVTGESVITTPMVLYDVAHYNLILEGINVGDKETSWDGAIMAIDSGSAATYLPAKFYDPFASAMDEAIMRSGAQRAVDPSGFLKLCYQNVGDLTTAPKVTFRFSNKGNVEMVNTFVRLTSEVLCVAIVSTDGLAILGNLAQLDYMVGYDLDNRSVSFKLMDCGAS